MTIIITALTTSLIFSIVMALIGQKGKSKTNTKPRRKKPLNEPRTAPMEYENTMMGIDSITIKHEKPTLITKEMVEKAFKNNKKTDKKCSKCKEIKPSFMFNNRTASKDGLQAYCKECLKKINKLKKKPKEILPTGFKKCSTCRYIKPKAEFSLCKSTRDKLQYNCKECMKNYRIGREIR